MSDSNANKQSVSGGLTGKEKRNKECEAVMGRQLWSSESWCMEMAKKCAKRIFKDATEDFIKQNRLVLAMQQEFDFKCATCYGLPRRECPFGGHETYLRVDANTGLCLQYVNSAECGKVLE